MMDALGPLPPPSADLRFRARPSLRNAVADLVRSRELLRSVAERQFRIRYKQALLGATWAILTPVTLMVVFTVFFRRVATVDTNGAPYSLFAYLGLLPWSFFSTAFSQGGQSIVANKVLLNKVYCSREIFPISAVAVAGIDMLMATAALGVLFVITTFMPRPTSVWVPAILVVQVTFSLAASLALSALLVYLRDLQLALPILLQLGIFATPVAYGLDAVPESIRPLYVALNPLAAVIDSYRRVVLFGQRPSWLLGLAAISALLALTLAYMLFKRLEWGFADVA